MYQNILVPIDGSDTATSGLLEAIKLAQAGGGRLHLVNVYSTAVIALEYAAAYTALEELPNKLRAASEVLLKEAGDIVRQRGVQCDAVLLGTAIDNVGELIVSQAKQLSADLIVMGTHGRRGLARLVLGSTAEYVLRHSPVPMLLVRKQT
jgi:nucleotide-binding universal stress UspA family protein